MDHLKLSNSLGHQAQALLALEREVDAMLADRFGHNVTVKASRLKRIKACLHQGAELTDQI